jgi:membrane-bound metal-dependent hydrolase YbcI (DUF457 family)
MAAGWLVARPARGSAVDVVKSGAWFAVLGIVPDLDLLLGPHRAATHSFVAALIVGLAAAAITRRPRLGAAAACAYGSHVALDWLGADTAPPFGVMALWPFRHEHYLSGLDVFSGVRRHLAPGFWVFNLKAAVRELIILGPLTWIVFRLRVRAAR